MTYQETSREAFESVKPKLPNLQSQVIKKILLNGPSTCEELEHMLERSHQSVSATLTHLKADGVIEDSGERGITSTGRKAIKWNVADVKKAAQRTIETPRQLALAFQ
jgi:predicted transcriptional regulator